MAQTQAQRLALLEAHVEVLEARTGALVRTLTEDVRGIRELVDELLIALGCPPGPSRPALTLVRRSGGDD